MRNYLKEPTIDSLPQVAIVGCPNAGKSTLFNTLIGYRKSITDPTPGVTRDIIEERVTINGKDILLIDTGGYRLSERGSDEPPLDRSVREHTVSVLKRASLLLLVVEPGEPTGEELGLIEMVRSYSDKTAIIVNKIDTVEKEGLIYPFYNLGFPTIIGISAAHRRNLDSLYQLLEERVPDVPPSKEGQESDMIITLLGKPNTGKSTLANRLIGWEASLTSSMPGTTRDIVKNSFTYKGKSLSIIDTAGIRRKRQVKENIEYYSVTRALKSIEASDLVILLINVADGITDQDKKISEQVVKRGKGILLGVNKWDMRPDSIKGRRELETQIRFLFPLLDFAPIVPLSAKTGEGVDELLSTAFSVQQELGKRIETSRLNEALQDWTLFTPIKSVGGKSFKIRYLTQVSTNPVRFIAFVNRKKGFPEAYLRFLKNRIREEFHFKKIPFVVELRERT